MAELLSMPFRVAPSGAAVKVTQGDDSYYREQIAVVLLTEQGERFFHPALGLPDSAFDGFQHSAFQAQIVSEMPEITNLKARIEDNDDRTQTVTVEFSVSQERR